MREVSKCHELYLYCYIFIVSGLIAYFLYGYRHSLERDFDEQEVVLYEITENDTDRVQMNGD